MASSADLKCFPHQRLAGGFEVRTLSLLCFKHSPLLPPLPEFVCVHRSSPLSIYFFSRSSFKVLALIFLFLFWSHSQLFHPLNSPLHKSLQLLFINI